MSDYKPYLTADENSERTDKVSWNLVLDRNRLTLAERKLKRQGSMIEALINDDPDLSYLTDSDIAYSKSVPVRALAYAELSEIGGMCKKCENLLDFEAMWNGKTSNADTVLSITKISNGFTATITGTTNSWISFSGYNMDCKAGDTYTISYDKAIPSGVTNALVVTFRDSNHQQLAPVAVGVSPTTFTAPVGAVDMRIYPQFFSDGTEKTVSISNIMLVRGSTAKAYDPYFEGIKTAPVTNVMSRGFNIWDEEWRNGYYGPTGTFTQDSNYVASKNLVKCAPNTTYYVNINKVGRVCFYDKDETFLSTVVSPGNSLTTPNGCRYFAFDMLSSYGTTYNHDICINVSNASLNGTYMPYRAPINYPVPAEVQALDGYGWGINENCYNYIDFDRKVFVKKVARVDLGSLTWTTDNTGGSNKRMLASTSSAMNVKPSQSSSTVPNITCSKYDRVSGDAVYLENKGITIGTAVPPRIAVYDPNYNSDADVQSFKAAMQGVYLYYELATIVETDISEYLPYDDYIEVEAGGSVIFENTNEIDVPSTITYLQEAE